MEYLRAKVVLILVVAAGVLGGGFYNYLQGKNKESVEPSSVLASEAAANPDRAELVVYISGAVAHPGVIKVTAGSRVIDILNKVEGVTNTADISKINLAQKVKDGMHIYVPQQNKKAASITTAKKETDTNTSNTSRSQTAENERKIININTATKTELCELPGIGPKMAEQIIEYRNQTGLFGNINEIRNVKGLGEKKFKKIQDYITL